MALHISAYKAIIKGSAVGWKGGGGGNCWALVTLVQVFFFGAVPSICYCVSDRVGPLYLCIARVCFNSKALFFLDFSWLDD
jgi:hypothetical protein